MSEKKEARRYWLKLNAHYLDSEDMIYLESMENGEKYAIIWIRLLLLCLKDTEENAGFLRFKEGIPYSGTILARVLRKDVDTIRSAMTVFQELGMVTILDDGTLYIEEVQKMIGSEASSAKRVREHRERAKALQCNRGNALQSLHVTKTDVTLSHNTSKEKEVESEVDKDAREIEPLSGMTAPGSPVFWPINYDLCKSTYQAFETEYASIMPDRDRNIDAINRLVHYAEQTGEDPGIVLPAMLAKLKELKSGDNSTKGFWRTQPFLPTTLVALWPKVREHIKMQDQEQPDWDTLEIEADAIRAEQNGTKEVQFDDF